MNRKLLIAGLGAVLPLLLAGCAPHRAYYGAPPPPGYQQGRTEGYQGAAHKGYQEGMEAARQDMRRGMRPDAERHNEFRRPPVPPRAVRAYRDAFRDGYRYAYQHARQGDGDRD